MVDWLPVRSVREKRKTLLGRKLVSLWVQFVIAHQLFVRRSGYDVVIMFGGYLVPMILARIIGKKPIVYDA